jgi:hypothetical protein
LPLIFLIGEGPARGRSGSEFGVGEVERHAANFAAASGDASNQCRGIPRPVCDPPKRANAPCGLSGKQRADRYRAAASSEIVIDTRPRIAKLEQERANLVAAIKTGGLAEELGAELKGITAELARLKAERPEPMPAPRVLSTDSIERRREELLQRLAGGGAVAREMMREIFPNAIQLQPDEAGTHLWALFVDEADVIRVNLLYGSREDRLNEQHATVLAAFARSAEATAQVGNNGSGGAIPLLILRVA